MLNGQPIIQTEITRHATIYKAIAAYISDRNAQLLLHDTRYKALEAERFDTPMCQKDEITARMNVLEHQNPRIYLLPYENEASPYLSIVGIHDDDPKIGVKEYVIGKQSLTFGVKPYIVDWRKANVSRFFYGYDEGDDYDEEFVNKQGTIDRTGKITHKRTIGITQKLLNSIQTSTNSYKNINGIWVTKDGTALSTTISADVKTDTGDHQLIDIIALISKEQFRSITKNNSGCCFLTGGAGSGKTTVALHRLSYLQFNEPKLFNPDKCLVLVFNRTLKDYVKNTSKELLTTTAIDTFTSWGIAAIKNMGASNIEFSINQNGYDEIKKHSAIEWLLSMYIDMNSNKSLTPYQDLMQFYTSDQCATYFFKDDSDSSKMIKFIQLHSKNDNKLSYADVGVLLRLMQLRNKTEEIKGAFNYYDHIVADEAQDFAQHELEAIFASLNKRKSLTICADEKQKILSFVDATGLSNFKTELNSIGLDKTTFSVGYRSAPEIMDIANVVAGRTNSIKCKFTHNNDIVTISKVTTAYTAIPEISTIIKRYQQQDPSSLTAIICKTKADIAIIHKGISGNPAIRNLHPAGTIIFTPGVIVTNAHQVKGLEFTNVILWNPSNKIYRNNEVDKNLLYVAISRACKRLAIVHFDVLSSWFKL